MSVRQAPVSFYEKGKQMKKGEILEGVVKDAPFPEQGNPGDRGRACEW